MKITNILYNFCRIFDQNIIDPIGDGINWIFDNAAYIVIAFGAVCMTIGTIMSIITVFHKSLLWGIIATTVVTFVYLIAFVKIFLAWYENRKTSVDCYDRTGGLGG